MVLWTLSEYIEAHPTTPPYTIIQYWVPDAPEESNDPLSDWYAGNYNLLSRNIDTYQENIADDTNPDAALIMALDSWGTKDINTVKEDPPTVKVVPTDPEDPLTKNVNKNSNGVGGSGIYSTTMIGGIWVDQDIKSINTSQISNADEGNEQSTCTVILNNNNQKYGKLISTYTWCPKITGIWSKVFVDINQQDGTYTTSSYMLFQGWMADASYNHETATIKFGCIGIIADSSYDDKSWSPDDGYITKMEDVKALIEAGSGKKIDMADLRTKPELLHKQFFAPSDISGSENLRSIAKDNKESFYYATDWEDNSYIVLIDSGSWTDRMFLDPYVINPGDTSTVYGHANKVTIIAGSTSNEVTMKHIPTPLKQEVIGIKWNDESIGRYGPLPAYIVSDSNLPSYEKEFESDIMDDNFKQYIDRDIKVSVANKVPLVLSIVAFTVPDVLSGDNIYVFGCVKKKQVEFSTAGLVTHLECARINSDLVIDDPAKKGAVQTRMGWDDSNRNRWEYEWNPETQKWDLSVVYYNDGIWAPPQLYTDDVPQEVADHFDLNSIENANDSIDANWRN